MVLRFVFKFARYRSKWASFSVSTLPRASTARIFLGVSAAISLATLNKMHGDAEEEGNAPNSSENSGDSPLSAGFTADKSMWYLPIRYLGNRVPDGIIRMYWFTRFDTHIRVMSRGSRSLVSILEGDFVTRTNVADLIEENLWFNLEALFRWYQIDHSTPQPVEFSHEPHPSPEAIHSVIKTAINFTDEYILNYFLGRVFSSLSKKNAPGAIRATSASCLISALYEDDVRLLHVASLGNMRAILGRPRPAAEDGTVIYDVHVLSADHTPTNPTERSRIQALHDGEEVFENDRLFGRTYTRALGDAKLKWSTDTQHRLHQDYLGAAPDPKLKTPPYMSAEPDVSTIKIEPGDFLVMSSSWLGECLTDEEVVGLVGAWLNKNGETNLWLPLSEAVPDPTPGVVLDPDELPVKLKEDKTIMYKRWNVPKRFVNTDPNPTAHLATNAMGGADQDLNTALLELAPFESEGNTKSLAIAILFFQ